MPKKASTRTQICSSCLDEVGSRDMYTVMKPMHPGAQIGNHYYTPFCPKCVEQFPGSYLGIHAEPKNKK